ncbi:MAG: serine hydrolase domain-containing protein [Saprospiraceae bacterium]|nr:beta-lactamase family protein [Lewinella sp.]
MKSILFAAFSIALVIMSACSANKQQSRETEQLNTAVRQIILSNSEDTLNGSILIAKGPDILVRQNYGFIDVAKTAPITDQSRFNIGSACKEIPGMAILELIRLGKMSYDDKLDRYLKDLPTWAGKISIRDLLFYKSGLPPFNFVTSGNDEFALANLRYIENLPFEPGTHYLYDNWNNFLQAKIVESVVQQGFQSWVKDHFFQPLEMQSAVYTGNPPSISENMTWAYSKAHGDDVRYNPRYKQFALCYAPLYMTALDLYKWISYVQQQYEEGGEAIPEFFQPTSLEGQGPLGVTEWEDGQVKLHRHGGAAYSFGNRIYRDYHSRLTIIIMSNADQWAEMERIEQELLNWWADNN